MINVDPSQAIIRFGQINSSLKSKLTHQAEYAAAKMVAYAKSNKPWVDRSKSARDTISSSVEWNNNNLKISLTSGVNYGIYLEFVCFKHKGRLSIWWPTINAHRDRVLRSFSTALRRERP